MGGGRRVTRVNDNPFPLNEPLPLPEIEAPPPPRRRTTVLVMPLVLVAVVAGVSVWLLGGSHSKHPFAAVIDGGAYVAEFTTDSPDLHVVSQPHRQLPTVTGPSGATGFTVFTGTKWDPCEPIHWVSHGTPPFQGADRIVSDAIDEVSRDTGLRFIHEGTTDEAPDIDRSAYQPQRYGDEWAPVLVAWTDSNETSDLSGDITGEGGPIGARLGAQRAYVSGFVYLDRDDLAGSGPRARSEMRATVLHELGHLVGLSHTRDRSELMYPKQSADSPTDFAAGDLRGLARMGQGPCERYAAG